MTHSSTTRLRVAAYVIRRTGTGPQLLVFDQVGVPAAGTQIPAGGVEPGEALSDAVVREIAEETGLTDVTLVAELGAEDKPHPETGQPRHTTYFHVHVPSCGRSSWIHRVRAAGQDNGLRFACRFTALPLSAHLADHQDVFLDRIAPAWATTTHRSR
ncbi:NUDIX domain-containing protein [Saccharopolyspora erythraea]|uniref:NUDIX hydrolase n=1 Tax=Saccharopolyspora erythraea TaxID=1836 RepID=UPI001BA6848A|nr:NUDIX domain-containing protein [Saccharopolyspora erythraea]QUH03003.1 NUDIX domain-containing protein [Saccharopolyspora erythraea]